MGRKLNATVLVDGVVYDLGTDEADVEGVISDELWDGELDPDAPSAASRARVTPGTGSETSSAVDDLREVLEAIAAKVVSTDVLLRLIADQLGIAAPDQEPAAGPVDYTDWKVTDLKAEVERRNAERDADHVTVDEPGNKPELIAALAADDTVS